jgi:anti-sigma factor RsiW
MQCRHAEILIHKSLDEPLAPRERAFLDRHVQTCDACRTAWAEFRQLSRAADQWMAGANSDDPGGEFVDNVMARIAAEKPAQPLTGTRRAEQQIGSDVNRQGLLLRAGAGLAAVAVILVLLACVFPATQEYTTVSQNWPTVLRANFDPAGYVVPSGTDIVFGLRRWLTLAASSVNGLTAPDWAPYVFLAALAGNAALGVTVVRRRRSPW